MCRSPMSTNIFPLASANMMLSRMCAKSIKFQALKNKPENHWRQRVKKKSQIALYLSTKITRNATELNRRMMVEEGGASDSRGRGSGSGTKGGRH